MTKICRYIDDPPQFLFWDIDELVIFSVFTGIGIISDTLTMLIGIGAIASFAMSKFKERQSEGFLHHILYWHGIFRLRGCPQSYFRTFIQ